MKLPPLLEGRRRRHLALLVLNGLAQAVLAVWFAQRIQALFEGLLEGDLPTDLGRQLALLVSLVLGIAVLRRRERVDAELLGQRYVRDLRKRIFARVLRSEPHAVQGLRQGQLLVRFVGDLGAVRQWVSLGVARLVVTAVVLMVVLVALAFLHPLFAALIGLVLGATAVALLWQGRHLHRAVVEARRRQGQLAANVTEKLAAVAAIQASGEERRERRRLARQNRRLLAAAGARAAAIGTLRAIVETGSGLALILALAATAWLAVDGRVNPSVVLAVFSLVGFLSSPLRQLGRVYEYRQAYRVAVSNLQRLLSRLRPQPRRPRAAVPGPHPGALTLEGVAVAGVLRPQHLAVAPGEHLALVGANGAGKSTLLAVLAGLRRPDAGTVLVDGTPLANYPGAQLRRLVGHLDSEPVLWRGTLERNLLYGAGAVSPERLQAVLERCGLQSLVERLPRGLRTRLGEGAPELSRGERMRIALARVLLREPRILLLDEVDAHLDAAALARLDQVLRTFPGTLVMATHRRPLPPLFQRVWHLRDGGLVEAATPARPPAPVVEARAWRRA